MLLRGDGRRGVGGVGGLEERVELGQRGREGLVHGALDGEAGRRLMAAAAELTGCLLYTSRCV